MQIDHHSGETDVAIVGAGAAGIGAGCALAAAKVRFVLLEAAPRVGGRAWTVRAGGFPVDMGCGWLHSADKNPWTSIAQRLGFTLDRSPPHWERQSSNHGFAGAEQRDFRRAWAAFQKRLRDAPLDHDVAASTLLEPGPWTPLMNSISSYINAALLDELSVCDLRKYEDTDINWRVVEGYGAVIARQAETLPVMLDCAVKRIAVARGGGVVLETAKGTLRAKKVIVTVSSDVLAAEMIAFDPALPEHMEAASQLPLGLVNKAFFACDMPFPDDGHLFAKIHSADAGSYTLRPFARPLIEGFYAGNVARELAREGEAALLDFGMSEMVNDLGSDARKHIYPLMASHWSGNAFIRGSYAHAKIGHADARAKLARSVNDKIFFAGEAVSPGGFSTAHGAYESGIAAAKAAIK